MNEQKKLEQEKIEKWITEVKQACKNPIIQEKGRWIDREEENSMKKQVSSNPQVPIFKILYVSLAFLFLVVLIIISKQGWLAPNVYVSTNITNPAGDIVINTPEVKPEVNVNLNNTVNMPSKIEIEIINST